MSTRPQRERYYGDEINRRTAERCQLHAVHWELTDRCNCRCTHCYVVKPGDVGFRSRGAELSTAEAKAIIDQLTALNVLHIAFSGGEVLCRSDFFEIAQHARDNRFAIRILTNGTLIDPEAADRIAGLYPVSVDMSVYGSGSETHDSITQVSGSFESTMRAFRLLAERKVRTRMKTPLMRENVGQFKQLRALAEDLGAEFRRDITITPKDNGATSPLQHRMTDDQLLWLFAEEYDGSFNPRILEEHDHVCLSGMNRITISPYGDVYPCVQVRLVSGNIREEPIGEIWQSSPVLESMRRLTLSDFAECATCSVRGYCRHCPGLAWLEDGDLLSPSSRACKETGLFYHIIEERRGEIHDPHRTGT